MTDSLSRQQVDFARVWKGSARYLVPVLAMIVAAGIFHWLSGESFLTSRNLSNLSRQVCVNLTLAVGMTLVILTAGIDLSVGSVLALAGMAAAISQVHGGLGEWGMLGASLSLGIGIGVGALCGGLTGFAVSRLGITPFIVTLGMMVICRGLTLIVSGAQAVAPLGSSLATVSSGYLAPLPSGIVLFFVFAAVVAWQGLRWRRGLETPLAFAGSTGMAALGCGLAGAVFCGYRGIPYLVFIAAICALGGMFALTYTRYGRFLYAIGGNTQAAELSGVPVQKSLWVTYLIMGALAGLAGVLDTARVNGAVPSAGELAELDAIAAVVIGGTSLMGGVGRISGTILGVLIMGVLNNGMSLVGVSDHYQKVFKGLVIILAVYLDMRSKKRSA